MCVCFYFCVIFIFFCFVCPDYSLLSLSKVGKGGGGARSSPGIMNIVKIHIYIYIYIYI